MKYVGWVIAVLACLGWFIYSINIKLSGQDLFYEKMINDNGLISYKILLDNYQQIEVGLNEKGTIDYLKTFPSDHQQVISFYDSGIIRSKIKRDENDVTQGRAYYFYKESGNLSSDYNYSNGFRVGSAVSYYDTSDHIKEVMLYNDDGELYHRKTFDWHGNLIKVEGEER